MSIYSQNTDTPTPEADALEESIAQSFQSTASVPSDVDLTRMKARAESIPSSSVIVPSILRPAWVMGACVLGAVILFQVSNEGSMDTNGSVTATELTPQETASLFADAKNSTADEPEMFQEQWENESFEPYLEIGWEDEFELDMLHGSSDRDQAALILAVYESL